MSKVRMNSFKISSNYWLSEFQCKCCGTVKIANRVVELLELATKGIGEKLEILSAYRCPKHNEEVGGVRDSYHVKGMAVDIKKPKRFDRIEDFAAFLARTGFSGIGIYEKQGFVHADIGPKRTWRE